MRLQYEVQPERPTAECHLQPAEDEPALCGHVWEGLVPIPGSPSWLDLHPDLRCADCSRLAGYPLDDAVSRTYRFALADDPRYPS